MRPAYRTALALLLAAPLASHALHVCTDANGKSSFQDKPCETRAAAAQFVPIKARALNDAVALETMTRVTAAMGARDVAALQRMLARGFESRMTIKVNGHEDPVVANANQFAMILTRALNAAKTYRIQRTCKRDPAGDNGTEILALRCSYNDRLELLNRVLTSRGDEFVRVVIENGEAKLVELSEAPAADAARGKQTAQAGR